MAANVALRHLSVATADGCTARPGGHQAAFAAEVAAEEEAEHPRLTVAAYEAYQRGILPAGKGARDLVTAFRSVDRLLDRHGGLTPLIWAHVAMHGEFTLNMTSRWDCPPGTAHWRPWARVASR